MSVTPSFDTAIIGTANKLIATGSATAVAAGAAEATGKAVDLFGTYGTEIAAVGAILGVLFGAVGLAVQTYFSWRRDKREAAESTWRMGDPDRRKPWRRGVDPDRRRNWRAGVDQDRRRNRWD